MAVTKQQVNQLYGQLLGRQGQDQYLEGWANSGMSIDQIAEAIADSPEGQAYQASQNQPGDSPPGTGAGTEPQVTTAQVNALYEQELGRPGQEQYLKGWAESGMTLDQIRAGIADSPEGQAYAASQNETSQTTMVAPEIYTAPGTTTNVMGQTTVGSNNPVQGTIEVLFERQYGRMPTTEETLTYLNQYNQTGDINLVNDAIIESVSAGGTGGGGTGGGSTGAGSSQAILDEIKAQQAAHLAQQQALLDQIAAERQAQADKLAAQQQAQADMFSTYGQAAKGGRGQQPQSAFGDAAPQPPSSASPENSSASPENVDTGGGYYRNPYSSGYGMGYQNPFASQMYLPQSGLMGPSGFGGKGGYRPPMPYGGMSPGKGGYYGGRPGPFGPDSAGDTSIPPTPPTEGAAVPPPTPAGATPPAGGATPPPMYPMYPMYPMRPMYPMYGGKGGYYR